MKKLLAFLLLSGRLSALCADGNLSYIYDGFGITGPCSGNYWAAVGTPNFDTAAPSCGLPTAQYREGFAAGSYDAADATFKTLFSSSNFTVEGYFFPTGNPAFDVLVRWNGTSPDAWELMCTTTGVSTTALTLRRFSGSWLGVTTGSAVTVGYCYYFAGTNDGTNTKIYLGEPGVSAVTERATSALMGGNSSSISVFYTGSDTSSFVHGQLSGVRFSTVVRTSFPTVDPPGDTQLSPYQWNINSPNMFPNRLRSMLPWFMGLFIPRRLQALETDSRPVATAVAVRTLRSREALYTPTKTVTPRRGTATPSPSNTPNRSPTVTPTARRTP